MSIIAKPSAAQDLGLPCLLTLLSPPLTRAGFRRGTVGEGLALPVDRIRDFWRDDEPGPALSIYHL